MDAATLTDALIAGGMLLALGCVVAVGGRKDDLQQRALGAWVSLCGVVVAAVAAGAWHGVAWGQATALALLAIGCSSFALMSPTKAADAGDDEVRP
jgi:hypothetical protein